MQTLYSSGERTGLSDGKAGPIVDAKHPDFGLQGAKGNGKTVSDGSIVARSVILQSATGHFAPGDVGKYISIVGAGPAGSPLITTVSAYSSPTALRLSDPARTTVIGTTVLWGTDDTKALQDAIDHIHSLGAGTLLLPNGICILATPPTDGYTLLRSRSGVSVSGVGPNSVLMVGPGIRNKSTGTAVLYNQKEVLKDIVYRDFCIDFNGHHNLVLRGYSNTAGVNRTGGGIGCTNILIDNVVLKNAAGRHFLYFGSGPKASNITIRNCQFREWGQSIAGNQVSDFSGIYVDADTCEINGNTLVNSRPCSISTAIETHGSEQNIHDNRVTNAGTGYNLGGDIRITRAINFHNNTLRKVIDGVFIWTADGLTLSSVKIHDNVIGLREAEPPYAAGTGINASARFNASRTNVDNVEVQTNEIFGESTVLESVPTTGMFLQRIDDLTISGNKIHDLVGEAIYLSSEASPPRAMAHIKIISNVITNVGMTSIPNRRRAIALNSLKGADQRISEIDILNNVIKLGPSGGITPDYGIQFNSGSFPNTRIIGNTITGFRVSPIEKKASVAGDLFYVNGEGAVSPFNNIRASLGSWWVDTSSTPHRIFSHIKVASDGDFDGWISISFDNSPPTGGTYREGDIVYHPSPASAGFVGWVCTLGGAPGIWSMFGRIA